MRAGDVILEFNGRTVPNSADLVKMVTATKPGTSVSVKVLRQEGTQYRERSLTVVVDELDLEAEQQGNRSRPNVPDQQTPDQQDDESFGLQLRTVTPQVARQLQLPSNQRGAAVIEVDPNGPAARRLLEGDVILSINGVRTETAADAGRELQRIEAGRNARILLWRNGAEMFVIIRKE
jgi:serine protease Do